jgi:hypothetical protein
MKYAILITAASALLASPSAFAQGSSTSTPGQQMQDRGSATGSPGASEYAPGQQDKGSVKGTTGASGYAPGHTTTNANTAKDRMHKDKSKSKY